MAIGITYTYRHVPSFKATFSLSTRSDSCVIILFDLSEIELDSNQKYLKILFHSFELNQQLNVIIMTHSELMLLVPPKYPNMLLP
jgi:hypothetical protein